MSLDVERLDLADMGALTGIVEEARESGARGVVLDVAESTAVDPTAVLAYHLLGDGDLVLGFSGLSPERCDELAAEPRLRDLALATSWIDAVRELTASMVTIVPMPIAA